MRTNCEICSILERGHGESGRLVKRTSLAAILLLSRQRADYALIAVPNRHCESLMDLSKEELIAIGEILHTAAQAIEISINPDGLNTWTDYGEIANQRFPHMCFELVPRFKNVAYSFISNTSDMSKVCTLKLDRQFQKLSKVVEEIESSSG